MNHAHKNSAELEREVEAQRQRVEQTIGEIQERLSPGQLLDEVLSYTKHGGRHFAANLGKQVSENPLPATLLGVSLAWLIMGKPNGGGDSQRVGYPLARTSSTGLRRVSHSMDQMGDWYSEFVDEAGRKYRARADESGKRLGHFVDDTGKLFSGFVDETGRRVHQFRDEAGNLMETASGWASHTWHDLREGAGSVMQSAAHLGGEVQARAGQMSRSAMHRLEEQPLLAGALAFAAGAAIGAALPHTRQEDEMVGEAADRVKRQAGTMAEDMYEKGKEQAARLHDEASHKAGEVYKTARSALGEQEGEKSPPMRH